MKLSEILGQPRATTHLQNALEQDRLAHGLIFSGPAGVGKKTTALALARALFCTAEIPDGTGGCEQCEDCHLIEAGTHPNLLIQDMARAREEKSTASQISIAQIRRLRSETQDLESQKAAIIAQANATVIRQKTPSPCP